MAMDAIVLPEDAASRSIVLCAYPWDPLSRIAKEFQDILNDRLEYCTVVQPDENNPYFWKTNLIGPAFTPYENGNFCLAVKFPTDFPRSPPRIVFETPVFHPNINPGGEICLDILGSRWAPGISMSKIFLAISSLMLFPIIDDAINPDVAKMLMEKPDMFQKIARRWTCDYAAY